MLHTIIVYYNFCNYKSRYDVAKKFIEKYDKILNLYIVELTINNQEYVFTEKNNNKHLQLNTSCFFWYKENLINIAINKLLPKDWKYVSWIDCNIEFENDDFVDKTIDQLQKYDFVQMFSTIKYLDNDNNIMNIYKSFVYSINTELDLSSKPGGAWACTRCGYNKISKLFEVSLCESDCILAHALCLKKNYYKNKNSKYVKIVDKYVNNIIENNVSVHYANNKIKYYWHGNQENRNYHIFRKNMIMKYNYDPKEHLYYENDIIKLNEKYVDIINYTEKYFHSRSEDNL